MSEIELQEIKEQNEKSARRLFILAENNKDYDGMRFIANTYAFLFPDNRIEISDMTQAVRNFLPW